MKSTGIVRRIDELGRIVIPKEMRRTLAIKVGDSLEIFADGENLVLAKYQELLKIEKLAQNLCDSVAETCGVMVLIADGQKIICENKRGNSYLGMPVSKKIATAMENRSHLKGGDLVGQDSIVLGANFESANFHTIIASGEAPGGVIICSLEPENDIILDQIGELCAVYIAKYLG